jgi:hypothetical protein
MKTQLAKFILCLALVLPFTLAHGAVNLVFNTPTQNITPGGTFNVTLSLQTTAGEQVTGVDYYLQELSAAGFFIVDRNMAASPFAGVIFFDDTLVESSGDAAAPAGPDNALNTRNDYDLGGDTSPTGTTVTGTVFVGTFTIGVPNTLTQGQQFTISTTSNPGTGWVGPGPSFTDNSFNSNASVLLTVVPEPATWSLLGLGALGAFGFNLLRSRVRR